MKNLLLTLFFIFSISFSFSQECGKSELSTDLIQRKANDSVYKKSIEQRIDFFAILNKEILPKYSDLKTQVLNSIENSDLNEILELKTTYDNNRIEYLTEMKETQARVFSDVTAYGKIYTIILFETLDVFPDSYAMIFNSTVINSRIKGRDKILMNRIYEKYSTILSEFNTCFQQMKSEINNFKSELEIIDINQNTGNKTEEETKKADLIDLLIWSLK
tara:strand:- start:2324 stop:2977 length:654 start_codon:yes stop_codon:yes gene_type:complete